MSGQVLITFDDGTRDHAAAAAVLQKQGLCGTFGIVTDRIDGVGFLDRNQLNIMQHDGHFICNHSATHPWSGMGAPKPGIPACTKDEITQDYIAGKGALFQGGFYGCNYLLIPFGTSNIAGETHAEELLKEFKWMRLTVGAPLPKESGGWTPRGGKRLYPRNYNGKMIGISAAADVRYPDGIREVVDNAVHCEALAVLAYHSVCHVVGETQNVTWGRFIDDMDHIAELVAAKKLECVTPNMLVGE